VVSSLSPPHNLRTPLKDFFPFKLFFFDGLRDSNLKRRSSSRLPFALLKVSVAAGVPTDCFPPLVYGRIPSFSRFEAIGTFSAPFALFFSCLRTPTPSVFFSHLACPILRFSAFLQISPSPPLLAFLFLAAASALYHSFLRLPIKVISFFPLPRIL